MITVRNETILQESRVLKFWFSPETEYFDRVTCAYEFFKELVRPENFPRGNYQASCCLSVCLSEADIEPNIKQS